MLLHKIIGRNLAIGRLSYALKDGRRGKSDPVDVFEEGLLQNFDLPGKLRGRNILLRKVLVDLHDAKGNLKRDQKSTIASLFFVTFYATRK